MRNVFSVADIVLCAQDDNVTRSTAIAGNKTGAKEASFHDAGSSDALTEKY